jgi:hypothetical protein
MANYVDSNLALAQAKLMGKFKSESLKYRTPSTFLKIKELTEIMMPSHKAIRTREDRTVEAYTFARTSRSLSTGRAHDHTGTKGDSLTLTPSWTTYSDPFAISLKQGDNNVFSYQEQFENEIENSIRNFAEGLEAASIDFLVNSRSTVGATSSLATYDATDDLYTIPVADLPQGVQTAEIIMEENDLKGEYVFFCDSKSYRQFEFNMNQGQGNATNLGFQYGNSEFVHSIGLDNVLNAASSATYSDGVFCVVPKDALASLDWIPVQNRQGVSTKEQSYMSIVNPIDGLTYAFHEYAERSDDSLTNGYTQDELKQYELSIDIALETAPLTTGGETCIQFFAFV